MVAVTVAAIIGTMMANPLWVSSRTSASPDSGACIAAPIMAAAPIIAKAPDGEPGQARFQAMPRAPPSTAPVLRVGVNRPPDAPQPRHSAVSSGLSAPRVRNRPIEPAPRKASRAMSFPLPNSWGYQIPMTPRTPKAASRANKAARSAARWWEIQPMRRIYPADSSPMTGPASSAQVIRVPVNR
jgi:hypothetical protein